MVYLDKYFDMFNHEYLESVYNACRNYLDEMLDDQDAPSNTKAVTSPEVQTCTTIIKGLQDYVDQGRHEEMKYMKLLAANEAFKFYCGMISKVLEYDIIDKKQARRRITRMYKECGLAG